MTFVLSDLERVFSGFWIMIKRCLRDGVTIIDVLAKMKPQRAIYCGDVQHCKIVHGLIRENRKKEATLHVPGKSPSPVLM